MDLGLKGKTVLVTGGAGGIGFGCAKVLAGEGCNIILADINDELAAERKQELIDQYKVKAWAVNINVMDAECIKKAWAQIAGEIGKVDILVNNAGGRLNRGPINELTDEEWMKTFDLTIHSAFLMSKEFANQYTGENGFGSIVNMTSKSAIMSSSSGNSHYASAKAAVIGMTRAMAKDLYDKRIRCNCVAPGYVKTEKTYPDGDPRTTEKKKILLTHEFAVPEDIGNVVAFLCSDKAHQMIGCVVDVTGGTLI